MCCYPEKSRSAANKKKNEIKLLRACWLQWNFFSFKREYKTKNTSLELHCILFQHAHIMFQSDEIGGEEDSNCRDQSCAQLLLHLSVLSSSLPQRNFPPVRFLSGFKPSWKTRLLQVAQRGCLYRICKVFSTPTFCNNIYFHISHIKEIQAWGNQCSVTVLILM